MNPPASGPTAHPPNALPPGTRLGEFEVRSLLGIGGFGIVYLAFDHALEREVAIKEYMPAMLAGRTETMHVSLRSLSDAETFELGLRSFVNEAKLLARFDHPSLVKVYRFWEAHDTAYMAMPVYRGRTLKDTRQAMAGSPDEAWLRALLVPLLGAIEQLHAQEVFHRDIAPDNILIEPDGRPVLLDFGAARRVIHDKSQNLTAILKPNYAPIEQYAEATGVRQGPWTDLYALGATLHFALVGQAPAPATARALFDELPPLSTRSLPGCSVDFLHAIDWMLAMRPADRPQSVAALRAVLDGAAPPEPAPAPPPAPASWSRTILQPPAARRPGDGPTAPAEATMIDVSASPPTTVTLPAPHRTVAQERPADPSSAAAMERTQADIPIEQPAGAAGAAAARPFADDDGAPTGRPTASSAETSADPALELRADIRGDLRPGAGPTPGSAAGVSTGRATPQRSPAAPGDSRTGRRVAGLAAGLALAVAGGWYWLTTATTADPVSASAASAASGASVASAPSTSGAAALAAASATMPLPPPESKVTTVLTPSLARAGSPPTGTPATSTAGGATTAPSVRRPAVEAPPVAPGPATAALPSTPTSGPVAAAPSTDARPPVAAVPVAPLAAASQAAAAQAASEDPSALCGKRVLLAQFVCMERTCRKPENEKHPACRAWWKQNPGQQP